MSGRRTTFKTEGFKEMDQALSELSRVTAINVAKRALLKAGQPVADRAKQLVPVRSGGLRDSIKVSTKAANRVGKAEYAAAMKSGLGKAAAAEALRSARRHAGSRSTVTVLIGAGQQPHAHMVEFGSVNNTPQPYLRPAWDEGKQQVLDDIKAEMATEVDKATKRARAKALKAK